MQTAVAAEPGSLPISLRLLSSSDSASEAASGEAVLPLISRNLRKRRNGGACGISVGVAALVAVAAVAATYMVLRCTLYLANASKSRNALRYLAGAEGEADTDPRGPCAEPWRHSPAAADAVAEKVEEEEALVEEDLIKAACRYAVELTRLINTSEPLVRELNPQLRAKCIAAFLRLSLVEFSALFSLLEGRERVTLQREIHAIHRRIWALRESLGRESISISRQRHIKCLHTFLGRLAEVKPTASTLAKRQRLLRIKNLAQLQDVALSQLNAGLFWLKNLLKSCKKASDGANAAAAAGEGAAAAAQGTAAAAVPPKATTDARVAAVVRAIEVTAHRRREQVLVDPLLSHWLRQIHAGDLHYGIVKKKHFESITRKPLQTQRKLLEALQATPLGSGDEPWEHVCLEKIDAQQRTIRSSVPKAPCRGDSMSPSDSPNRAIDTQCLLKLPQMQEWLQLLGLSK
ncbi:hypothetical protein, conserved [Eimeria praecox]|uniref:Uncharacterized protein n=1 Tax=Eimeria praecox TaxID=51316 RepID=U6G8U4_9EIME|nr:hypothetical protein, conserved [Eimeria praecox]